MKEVTACKHDSKASAACDTYDTAARPGRRYYAYSAVSGQIGEREYILMFASARLQRIGTVAHVRRRQSSHAHGHNRRTQVCGGSGR